MSVFDKFKDMMGVPEEDDYGMEDIDYSNEPQGGYYEEEPAAYTTQRAEPAKQRSGNTGGNKVMNVSSTMQLQVVLVKPERFEDASTIADHLNTKRTVVLNLESTGKEVSRRLVDFLSGVAYANNGQIKRVANSTFIITPYNVDIMGDLLDELESSGVVF